MVAADAQKAERQYARDDARWADWMRRAHAGDTDAYAQLLSEIGPVIERFLRRRFGDADFVEDCVQECLMSIHRARISYDPARRFRPWMFAIVRHKAIDELRRRGTRGRFEVREEEGAGTAAPDAEPGAGLEVAGVLHALEPKYREALVLTKLEGRELADAARLVGISATAMKSRVHRAIRQVRRILEADGEEE